VNWKARFKSEHFISAVEFGEKKPTLTIAGITNCKLEQDDGKEKDKAVIAFKEIDRQWVFCKTTGYCLSAMFGEDDTQWIGKRVTLHAEMVQVGPEKQPGIRITGSPDIDKPIKVKIKLAKKKAFYVTLVPTGKDVVAVETNNEEEKKEATA
jgi:hypothetical protein